MRRGYAILIVVGVVLTIFTLKFIYQDPLLAPSISLSNNDPVCWQPCSLTSTGAVSAITTLDWITFNHFARHSLDQLTLDQCQDVAGFVGKNSGPQGAANWRVFRNGQWPPTLGDCKDFIIQNSWRCSNDDSCELEWDDVVDFMENNVPGFSEVYLCDVCAPIIRDEFENIWDKIFKGEN